MCNDTFEQPSTEREGEGTCYSHRTDGASAPGDDPPTAVAGDVTTGAQGVCQVRVYSKADDEGHSPAAALHGQQRPPLRQRAAHCAGHHRIWSRPSGAAAGA